MLDTHTHILWNIDDGSKNQCMSLQMLEIAARSGTKAIFATPHVIERANKPSWEEIKEKTQQLRQLCAEAQIDIMLYPGAEVQMNWELLPELGATGAYCLNGGRYLLVELPAAEIPAYADEFWDELELKGIMPILRGISSCAKTLTCCYCGGGVACLCSATAAALPACSAAASARMPRSCWQMVWSIC